MKRILYTIITIAALAGCKEKIGPEDCFMAAGKESERKIQPGNFSAIIAGDRFSLVIKQDTGANPEVVVKGGSNVIKNVSVVIDNGKLVIDDRNVCNWTRDFSRKIKIEITCKQLHGLTVNDACEITSTDTLLSDSIVVFQRSTGTLKLNFKVGKLEVNHEAGGEIDLEGYAAVFVPVMFDAGKMDARNLQGDYTFAYHYGINDLHVKPFKVLYAFLGNTGNIFYYAEPFEQPLKVTRVGSGNIERK